VFGGGGVVLHRGEEHKEFTLINLEALLELAYKETCVSLG